MTPEEIARLPYRPCVGVMLADMRGQLFVGERIDTPGAWQMPQGGIDDGETPQQAALRELGEETGVPADLTQIVAETDDWIAYDLPHDIVPRIWKGRYRGQRQKWVLVRFLGQDRDINIEVEHPEFSRWRWMNPDDVLNHIVPFKRNVYSAALSALRPSL
ncbi:MAG: RNA pyrophosphohydrolase [Alphaproteobacteria bacterium]|nr:RNA pyrophosphohydrolase [Alphaproteobacteria bacterium]NNF24469.1 RNA pyrophosphohydrolase [Paracoccaceae bacterium]